MLEIKRDLMSRLQELPGIENLVERREVLMEYRGVPVKMKVASLIEEAAMRFDCAVRTRAVQVGHLSKLSGEDALVNESGEVVMIDVENSVLRAGEAARVLFNRAMSTSESSDTTGVQARLRLELLNSHSGLSPFLLDKSYRMGLWPFFFLFVTDCLGKMHIFLS